MSDAEPAPRRPWLVFVAMLTIIGGALAIVAMVNKGPRDEHEVAQAGDEAIVRAFLSAMARADLTEARTYMTNECWTQIEREMRLFQAELADPRKGAAFRTTAEERLGAAAAPALAEAARGGVLETWKFLLKLVPMDDPPRMAGIGLDPKSPSKRQYFYWTREGVRRPVGLRLQGGVWKVEYVGLL